MSIFHVTSVAALDTCSFVRYICHLLHLFSMNFKSQLFSDNFGTGRLFVHESMNRPTVLVVAPLRANYLVEVTRGQLLIGQEVRGFFPHLLFTLLHFSPALFSLVLSVALVKPDLYIYLSSVLSGFSPRLSFISYETSITSQSSCYKVKLEQQLLSAVKETHPESGSAQIGIIYNLNDDVY